MRPENAARTLASIGAALLILAAFMRLLSVYLLLSDARLQDPRTQSPGPQPAMGNFILSNDRQVVRFDRGVWKDGVWQGGSYLLDLQTGSVTPGDLPEIPQIYSVETGQVLLILPNKGPQLALSTPGLNAIETQLATDGQGFAFVNETAPDLKSLYALRGSEPTEFIMQADDFRQIAWSTDNEALVFVVSSQGRDEIFTYSFANRQATALTSDGVSKSSPVFSPDGRQIAYLAAREQAENAVSPIENSPTSLPDPSSYFSPVGKLINDKVDIYLMNADGSQIRQLTDTPSAETDLAWRSNDEVLFARSEPSWPSLAYLYAVSTTNGDQRRVYPPAAIDAFDCQPVLPGGNQVDVRITLSNTSDQEMTVPLEVSAYGQPLDLLTNRSQFRVQREDISLAASETRTIPWSVAVPEDIRVYLSASIESGVDFPISARFCESTPRRWFLPRLPLLRTTLLISLLGSVLCLPWLRHARRIKVLWFVIGSYWLLLLALIAIESWILLRS